ncbi:sensor histidine kinase [Aeromonas aquatica]|uniref:sensor histidine kinase n=1 Tax=Aeromonas aquatica TaxID=558964 RepID=UPI00286F423B|nr:sensor histidine kinase [Aeromonas aquatica]
MFAPLFLQPSPSFRCQRLSWLLSCLLLWLMALPALAAPEPSHPVSVSVQVEPVRVGVLATRGLPLARQQWQPLMDWLEQRVPSQHFTLVPLELDGLAEAVADERIDFVITNPGQLVSLSRQYPLAWLATLRSPDGGDNLAIGAALVVRADAPFQGWQDLKGEAVAAVSQEAFGGYLAYRFEAYQQGVRIDDFFSAINFTGFPLDRLISQLQRKAVAAAIVPVCQLERMAREGKIAYADFRVLDQQAATGLGCQSSTRLYPNWSLASTERVSPELALAVTRALFALPPDSEAARAADSAGWTVPTSPLAIDRLLKELDRHPLQSPWWQEAWHWLRQHQEWGWGALLLLALLGGHHLLLQQLFNRSQRRLLNARHRLDEQARQLEQARRLAELGELGANMAHEINQPLTAIAGYSQGALRRIAKQTQAPQDPALTLALEQIGQQVERISQTIGRLRSRWQKRPRSPDPTDLVALVARLTPPLEQMLAPLGVELILCWQGQPRRILLDGTGMEQLLVNLVKNGAESAAQTGKEAAQSTDAQPRVELRIAFEPDRLRLEVHDNGPGLAASQAQLRQAFYSSKADGMGLGLAICRDVVEFHRGHFSLSDAQPWGCLARVELPVIQPEADASSHPRN